MTTTDADKSALETRPWCRLAFEISAERRWIT
jgi:hypothetical protein